MPTTLSYLHSFFEQAAKSKSVWECEYNQPNRYIGWFEHHPFPPALHITNPLTSVNTVLVSRRRFVPMLRLYSTRLPDIPGIVDSYPAHGRHMPRPMLLQITESGQPGNLLLVWPVLMPVYSSMRQTWGQYAFVHWADSLNCLGHSYLPVVKAECLSY